MVASLGRVAIHVGPLDTAAAPTPSEDFEPSRRCIYDIYDGIHGTFLFSFGGSVACKSMVMWIPLGNAIIPGLLKGWVLRNWGLCNFEVNRKNLVLLEILVGCILTECQCNGL